MEQSTDSNNNFSRKVDLAAGTVHKSIDQAANAASPAIKHMTDSAHSTVDRMANGANHAAEAMSIKGAQLHHLQQQLADNTRSQIRNHPLMSIGIAVAGGVLFSWWLSRRSAGHEGN
ncbi:hypothetical protein MN202_08960 [Rheinheimera muenzenbergensis]|uniref:Membrane-anchored ribosome-binding protein, inhibits growth in stationary phase, ElaB/YqjD/DUF883 family n=1 Tax=Rheinheimera muenzenbergensis TaxID=1193628 RepID=A0ABU8C6R8_9GAMM